jgi:hypothetical protein
MQLIVIRRMISVVIGRDWIGRIAASGIRLEWISARRELTRVPTSRCSWTIAASTMRRPWMVAAISVTTTTKIQACQRRTPVCIGSAIRPERESPLTVRPHLIAPRLDAMIIVSRGTVVQRTSRMRVSTGAKVRRCGRCRMGRRRKLTHTCTAHRVMTERAGQRQPVSGERDGTERQGEESEEVSHARQNSSRLVAGSKFLASRPHSSVPLSLQSLQPTQPVLGHRAGNRNIDLIDTIQRLLIQNQVLGRQRFA